MDTEYFVQFPNKIDEGRVLKVRSWNNNWLSLTCKSAAVNTGIMSSDPPVETPFPALVSTAWLAEKLADPECKLVVLEVTMVVKEGQAQYIRWVPTNTRPYPTVGLMLGQRRRRWINIKQQWVDTKKYFDLNMVFVLFFVTLHGDPWLHRE